MSCMSKMSLNKRVMPKASAMFTFMMITLPNIWGIQEQATQKDGRIIYRHLLCGTLSLLMVLPQRLH